MGLGGAVVTGLGSILGTGVFVSIAVAAGFAGRWVLIAAPLAGLVATFNGLSSAQLAAAHPVAGGTYEYGHRFLDKRLGFTAGWLFLVAKTASAATAATGAAGYAVALLGVDPDVRRALSLVLVIVVTTAVAGGVRRTAVLNLVLVSVTITALVVFVTAAFSTESVTAITVGPRPGPGQLLPAIAFLFVAYTGYGRIATLGEEVVDPERTIPRAVITTLVVTAILYTAVAAAGWSASGGAWDLVAALDQSSGAPLAALIGDPWRQVVEVGAIVAMVGVLVNLILGLSRVWLAMGRRSDMPRPVSRISGRGSPTVAVWLTGAFVALGAVVDDVRTTWSFSAFAVLLYYAITNLAALRLPPEMRRFPRWVSLAGLGSCLFLSFFVPPAVWLTGVAVIAVGWLWRLLWRRGVQERTTL